MFLYTFIMEYAGGTYVSQVNAENQKAACVLWAQNLKVDEIYKFGEITKSQLVEQMKAEEPTALRGVINTWFISANLRGGSAYINLVRTAE
ncbi:MAG TPA: hypothetical protein VK308_11600 [Pyrinomonadaceae bacterium]|nr:hypothetical protein [Pyrinomonadaceae bacterium]